MPFIMGSWKILQRRTYDLLSHKYSFVFVLLGFLTLTVSVIQFGEVWIESQSDNSFNSFSDNVVGKPLQKKLCQIIPIDVVYTWVNGSDPLLLQQMLDYKTTMLKTSIKCHLSHCLPSHMAAFRGLAKKTEYKYNHKNVQIKQPGKQKGLQNWTVIEFPSVKDAMNAVFLSIDIGNNASTLTQAYWTSDKSVPNSYHYPNTVMITGLSPDVLSKLSETSSSQFSMIINLNIKEIWIDQEVQAIVLEFHNEPSSQDLDKLNNFAFFGHAINATKAYLVLELPPPWDSQDLAPSRFEDKEELRYSLRSLEIYAPWVRHVYLITNGQIPYWLNLDNPKLTLLTHEDIFPNSSHLPTFSSPAIESHIHRIPGLSQYFLYLNDDVFFGQEVWPEDFITHARGQKVYLSWPVPDCSESCPWSWIGDGSCDIACNISDCAFDGGDCHPSNENMFPNEDFYDEHHSDTLDSPIHDLFDEGPIDLHDLHNMDNLGKIAAGIEKSLQNQHNRTFTKQTNTSGTNNYTSPQTNLFISLQYGNVTSIHKTKFMKQERRKIKRSEIDKTTHNKLFTLLKNLESKENMETQRKWNFNRQLKLFNKPNNTFGLNNTVKGVTQNKLLDNSSMLHQKSVSFQNNYSLKSVTAWVHKKSKDTFAESLLFVNRLFNHEFGFEVRKVPAHMPHLIDKTVMNVLQNRFSVEWDRTSSHKIRNVRDMQYAFSYFYFLMSEKENRTITKIFDVFDTDRSGTWSDREIRTVLTQLFDLPLSYYKVVHFEEQICNCSLHTEGEHTISTPPYERYQDSKLPVVSKTLISKCEPIKHALLEKFGSQKKYQTEIVKDKNQAVTFKMLSSNLSQLIVMLDEVRRDPKKFICLNDNLDPTLEKDNAIVRAVLQDFYESLFPVPSNFELPLEYRNRFLHMSELKSWRAGRTILRNGIYTCIFLLMIFTALSFFRIECCSYQKRRSRRIYQEV